MCGIAGIINSNLSQEDMSETLGRMRQSLLHRGPDDSGEWQSANATAGFCHTRLAVLDLSAAGHQPMSTADGRFTITFNGEIYNFIELRKDLESTGDVFHTQTDTEVILRLYQRESSACVQRLRGMFAFAIWDSVEKNCFLARDPLGIKPLYYSQQQGQLVFASELRALCASQLFPRTLNAQAVQGYFETGSVPEPLTLLNEVSCLPAGHTLTWKAGQITLDEYWSVHFPESESSKEDPVALTRAALLDSVRHHFVSDVPVGIFLSGGIDSTALLALAKISGYDRVNTYSIAVDDAAADESDIARKSAAHFETQHHEMRLDATTAQPLFEEFLRHLDQPSIDGLNTFTVSALAQQQGMKVVLSGLGGDELFGGYSSFQTIPKMQRWYKALKLLPGAATLLDHGGPRHRRMADFVRSPGMVEDAYSSLRGIFSKTEATKLTTWISGEKSQKSDFIQPSAFSLQPSNTISELELTRYMRNQLLRDSDLMSMAHGLELRVPFVDRALFEAVASIPSAQRLQSNKKLLTDAVPEVPDWVVNQKKRGFLFPYHKWLVNEWGAEFDRVTVGAPVPTASWYQKWSLYILHKAINALHC